MDHLSERLRQFKVVGLDTSIFIYHFEANAKYLPLTRQLLSGIEKGEQKGVTSAITLMEMIVKPLSLGLIDVARKYEAMLANYPNLSIVDIDRDIIRQAARLRAEYRIRPPDALQVGACLFYGAEVFITNDGLLRRLQGELEVLVLDDFIE
jgi:predicted nucleic acid-binding protein